MFYWDYLLLFFSCFFSSLATPISPSPSPACLSSLGFDDCLLVKLHAYPQEGFLSCSFQLCVISFSSHFSWLSSFSLVLYACVLVWLLFISPRQFFPSSLLRGTALPPHSFPSFPASLSFVCLSVCFLCFVCFFPSVCHCTHAMRGRCTRTRSFTRLHSPFFQPLVHLNFHIMLLLLLFLFTSCVFLKILFVSHTFPSS